MSRENCERCCENSDRLDKRLTSLHQLCRKMVKQMKEHRCSYRATIIDVMNCNCDGCGTTQDLIHLYEELEKGGQS